MKINAIMISEDDEDYIEEERELPDKGEEEAALICTLSCGEQIEVLGHTGRFMFCQICEAGYSGIEVGLEDVPIDEPGFWVMRKGVVHESRDWETGLVDDVTVSGDWAPATIEDFKHFDVPIPDGLSGFVKQ